MAQVAEFRSFIGPSFREIRLPDGLMRYEFTMSVGGGLPDFPVQM